MGVGGASVYGALIGGSVEAAGKVFFPKKEDGFPGTVLSAEAWANSIDYLIVTGASFLLWGEPGLPALGLAVSFCGLDFCVGWILGSGSV